jgi:hypothetical protein
VTSLILSIEQDNILCSAAVPQSLSAACIISCSDKHAHQEPAECCIIPHTTPYHTKLHRKTTYFGMSQGGRDILPKTAPDLNTYELISPQDTTRHHAIPYHATSYHVTPCHTTSYHKMPHQIISRHMISYHIPHHTMPNDVI